MDVREVIGIMVSIMITFFVLSALISPTETSVQNIQTSLNGSVTGESLGTADGYGNLTATAAHPIVAGSETVYNGSGVASASWVNATVTVTDATGVVVVTATGTDNSTANSAITIDYIRSDTQADEVSDLPKVAFVIALILTFVGFIYAVYGRSS